ncbi:MAG: amidohydrolase family protein [Rhodospirillales bacterium]|jgi:predicted TIM-barrel fold metal-dependent hydrolase
MSNKSFPVKAIDAVVNIQTEEALSFRPSDRRIFYLEKLGIDEGTFTGIRHEEMLRRMDEAGIEKSFLIAPKIGREGLPAAYHVPYQIVVDAVEKYPDRFYGLAGIDPFEGMSGVRALEQAINEFGFIGAHVYPHWFELAPDHAKYYPFYAKCVELDVPIQMQVGQSLIYSPTSPMRSVGQPITIDTVACDFPELKIIGIHIGIPWHEEMIAMAWKHPNVYIGCDAHAPKHWPESFIKYINSYGQDKVIFGTDFPVIDFSRAMDDIAAHGFKPEVLAKLLRYNVERIYNLTD